MQQTSDPAGAGTSGTAYTTRFYEPRDRDGFLELYRSVMGPATEAWFEWKYERSPSVADVPIVVAVTETGTVVAARPQVPLEMTVGREQPLALFFSDTVVHEDHRRRGLFTRTTAHALAHYSSTRARFAFNFPNALSEPGYRQMGGEFVQELPTHYRVQNPRSFADRDAGLPKRVLLAVAGRMLSVARSTRRAVRRDANDVRTIRYEQPDPDRLAALADTTTTERAHALRDAAFFDRRFENPRYQYHVYYAERDGEDVGAVVTGTGRKGSGLVTNVMEPVPIDSTQRSDEVVRALLATVVADRRDADVLAFAGETIDRSTLRSYGFIADDTWPMSTVASPSRHLVYDLAGDGEQAWTVGGLDLRRADSWELTFSDNDSR